MSIDDTLKALRALSDKRGGGERHEQENVGAAYRGEASATGIEHTLAALRSAAVADQPTQTTYVPQPTYAGAPPAGGAGPAGGPQNQGSSRTSNLLGGIATSATLTGHPLIAGAAVLAKGLVRLNREVENSTNRIIDNNRVLENWNSEIAAVNVEESFRTAERAIRYGAQVSQGYGNLMEARSEYRDVMAERDAPLANLRMNLQALLTEMQTATVRNTSGAFMEAIRPMIDWANNQFPKRPQEIGQIESLLIDVSDGKINGVAGDFMNPTGNRDLLMNQRTRDRFSGSWDNDNPSMPRIP